MSADFQSEGHIPLSSDILKIIYSGVHRSYERHLNTATAELVWQLTHEFTHKLWIEFNIR